MLVKQNCLAESKAILERSIKMVEYKSFCKFRYLKYFKPLTFVSRVRLVEMVRR